MVIVKGKNSVSNISSLIKSISNYDNLGITSADFIGSRRWDITIDDKLLIKLPENDYINAIKNLNKILSNIEKFNYSLIEFVDLRFNNKAIVRFYNDDNMNIISDL